MNNTILNNKSIVRSFEKVLKSLSPKERKVIEKRVWLKWEKQTLQGIWGSFRPKITRERVRQLEDTWIKKMPRVVKNSILWKIQVKALEFVKMNWWLASKDRIMSYIIKELDLEPDVNSSIIEVVLQSDYEIEKSKQKLWSKIYFHVPLLNKDDVEKIYKEWAKILKRKKDAMSKSKLVEAISENLKLNDKYSSIFIYSALELNIEIVFWEDNLVWLEKWKLLNPSTIKDKAHYVLKREKIPMHFVDIANKITETMWDTVKVNTIHNELIRSNDFVLVWRWIYALKEWGFKPWTVVDVILELMKKKWEPMSTEEIIEEVLKIRNVKQSTIYMNLQNKEMIQRVGRNYYWPKVK